MAAAKSAAPATLMSFAGTSPAFLVAPESVVLESWAAAAATSRHIARTILLRADNHHLCRFNQCRRDVAFLQAHLGHGVGGNNAGDYLPCDRQAHLGHQPVYFDFQHTAHQLVASADLAEIAPGLGSPLH